MNNDWLEWENLSKMTPEEVHNKLVEEQKEFNEWYEEWIKKIE